MRRMALVSASTACAAVIFVRTAIADPTLGSFVNLRIPTPPMRCEVGSDDDPAVPGVSGVGPNVVCQTAGFPQAPMNPPPYAGWKGDPLALHQNQAIITASGQFSWRTANLGSAPADQPDTALVAGQTYHFEGWTIIPTNNDVRFANDATGHGMFIGSDYRVNPF